MSLPFFFIFDPKRNNKIRENVRSGLCFIQPMQRNARHSVRCTRNGVNDTLHAKMKSGTFVLIGFVQRVTLMHLSLKTDYHVTEICSTLNLAKINFKLTCFPVQPRVHRYSW